MATTIANAIKHSDLTMEQITEIEKNIKVVNKTEAFWDKFVQHDKTPKCDVIKYRKQILLDPTGVAKLTEGVIPDPSQIRLVEFSDSLFNVGSYIKYTRENLDNIDSIVELGMNQLAHDRLYDLEATKANAFIGTTCTFTKGSTWSKTLLALKTRLMKNHAMTLADGTFALIAPGEVVNEIIEEAGDKLKGSEAGAKVIADGFVGKYVGFSIFEKDTSEMYASKTESDKTTTYANVIVLGRNELGEFPVKARDFAGENAEVISKGIGADDKADPLNQFGTVGSRIDGIGAKLTNAECVLKASIALTEVVSDDYASELGKENGTAALADKTVPSK